MLEKREMLAGGNLFAEFIGLLNQPGDVERIPITIAPEKLGILGDKAYLGFQVHSRSGAGFDPAAAQIRDAGGALVAPQYVAANLAGLSDSVVVVGLGKGNYTLEITGVVNSRSQFQASVYLVGDVTGDHLVAQNDLDAIRDSYGSKAGDGRYQVAADANLDGRINAIDLALARRNEAASKPAKNLLGQFAGLLKQPGEVGLIPMNLALQNPAGTAYLAFRTRGLGGGDLDPEVLKIRRGDGTLVGAQYAIANLPGSTDSVLVARMTSGDYTLEVSGTATTRSHFQVEVFLVGDVNGDHLVGEDDLNTIRQIYGSKAGDAKYQLAADANLDGRINALDLALARRNRAAGTPLISRGEPIPQDVLACGTSTGLVSETGWGGVYDRLAAVTPTAGYKPNAAMEFFKSTVGWVQPLGAAAMPEGGVLYVPEDPTVTYTWSSREAGYGNDLVLYRVDDANGAIK
jgi:hypothetical protein